MPGVAAGQPDKGTLKAPRTDFLALRLSIRRLEVVDRLAGATVSANASAPNSDIAAQRQQLQKLTAL